MKSPNLPAKRFATGFFLVALAALGCSDDPTEPTGVRIVSDVDGPTCVISNTVCEATVEVPFHIEGADSLGNYAFDIRLDRGADGTVDETLDAGVVSGTFPDYVVNLTEPIDEYVIVINLLLGTALAVTENVAFQIADCRAPEPICINGLAVELNALAPPVDFDGDGDLDSAGVMLSATDFIASAIVDCSPPITYSINFNGETPDIEATSLALTCEDIGTRTVEVYAWDSANNPAAMQPDGTMGGPNYDQCASFVITQDNQGACN